MDLSRFKNFIKKISPLRIVSFLKQSGRYGLSAINKRQKEFDKKVVYSFSRSRIPNIKQLKYVGKFLSPRELLVIRVCFLIILANAGFWIYKGYRNNLETVPIAGGKYQEALVGQPQHINPLYDTINDVDSDISALIFSSLFKRDQSGKLAGDLVEDYSVSEDGKTYTLKIKDGVSWHDGEKLTEDDILFTFDAIKNSEYRSPLRTTFAGVEIRRGEGEREIKFVLSEAYAGFPELLTFGILPKHLWQTVPATSALLTELSLKPIGSGPYKFKSLVKDKNGSVKAYNLELNDNYYAKEPYIKEITFKFVSDYKEAVLALNERIVDGIGYLPKSMEAEVLAPFSFNFHRLDWPKESALFFNLDNDFFKTKNYRQALAYLTPRDAIVNDVLGADFARPINSAILPESFAYTGLEQKDYSPEKAFEIFKAAGWEEVEITEADVDKAREDESSEDEALKKASATVLSLGQGKWLKKSGNYLVVKISTIDTEENSKVAEALKSYWAAGGVKVIVEALPSADINSKIKAKDFQVLLYGLILGADPDPYIFWHSTQTGGNGLNISQFENKRVDAILEEARKTGDQAKRVELYKEFQEILADELPVIFLYSTYYNYVQSKDVKGFGAAVIYEPRERFSDIENWYVKTGKRIVWKK